MCCRTGTRHHNTVRGVTFPSHAWGIRPITMHWIAGQSEHASLLRTMSFVKIDAFQKGGHTGATIMYSMWKIMCFLNRKLHKHIALHQTHKIMFFLASYDPFKHCGLKTSYVFIKKRELILLYPHAVWEIFSECCQRRVREDGAQRVRELFFLKYRPWMVKYTHLYV